MFCCSIRGLPKNVIIWYVSVPSWVKTKTVPVACLGQVLYSGLTTMETNWTHRHEEEAKQHFSAQSPLRDSLLDAIESQGAATWLGVGVPVVVQRVYSLPWRCDLGSGSAAPPSSDPPRFRWVTRYRHGCRESLRESRGSSGSNFLAAFPIYMGCFCLFLSFLHQNSGPWCDKGVYLLYLCKKSY